VSARRAFFPGVGVPGMRVLSWLGGRFGRA
jgi:hypothetical protein